jgi:hypothetical protein
MVLLIRFRCISGRLVGDTHGTAFSSRDGHVSNRRSLLYANAIAGTVTALPFPIHEDCWPSKTHDLASLSGPIPPVTVFCANIRASEPSSA